MAAHKLSASDLFRSQRGCIRDICVCFLWLTNKEGWLPGILALSMSTWTFQQVCRCESVHPLLSSKELTFLLSLRRTHLFPIIAGLCIPLKAFSGIAIKYLSNTVCRICQGSLSNIYPCLLLFFIRLSLLISSVTNQMDGPLEKQVCEHICHPHYSVPVLVSLCYFSTWSSTSGSYESWERCWSKVD